ncbi:MAG: hypothetical protein DRJ03_26780 [Chloroflexi bacterium]|nr:MAG: hypothetical protein B6I34_03865 [Anaerolineaceae bacterium 4572_32.1]RLC77481.1 MAG: hypothetical protein DRJ03_26780 [Chloroflexota bacterium]
MTIQKVQIYRMGQTQPVVDCTAQFNPTQLQLSKKASWKTEKAPKKNIGTTTFGGGDPIKLSVKLFFDTTASGDDVRDYTEPLMNLTMIDVKRVGTLGTTLSSELAAKTASLVSKSAEIARVEDLSTSGWTKYWNYGAWERNTNEKKRLPALRSQKSRLEKKVQELTQQLADFQSGAIGGGATPPKCKFVWGSFSFVAVIPSVSVTFTMFLPSGAPVRATAKVDLIQIEDPFEQPPQNPTSRSVPRKVWVVKAGQRLDWIAYKEFGSAAMWRYIAQTNNLDNPWDLRAGQVLNL